MNRLYQVSESVFEKQRENIRTHWIQNRPNFSEDDLDRCYSLDRIKSCSSDRKPNILMAGYAFAAGGGETFPIQLANLFDKSGYGVTFCSIGS